MTAAREATVRGGLNRRWRTRRLVASLGAVALLLSACGGDGNGEAGNGDATDGSGIEDQPRVTHGVTDDEILVAYYWRGEGTGGSQFFGDREILVSEEAEAFVAFLHYLNENSGTGATFMGFEFDLHGRQFRPEILEGGTRPEQFSAVAERIAQEIQPFATVSGEGSISSYACPRLSQAGIFSIATMAMDFDLDGRSNGYCLPMHQAFETQVDLVAAYLAERAEVPYEGADGPEPRVFGIVHTEHPPLMNSVPRLQERFAEVGAEIAAVATLPQDLTVAQQQTGNVISRMRAAGVNTLILPDAGVPLTLTRAAGSQGYEPDYVVWPCSGMDLSGMGRLFQGSQWARAEGVTCYDQDFNVDIARDATAEETEWFQQYKAGSALDRDPPLNAELAYLSMFPLVVGVTNAGRDLTADSFIAGLEGFEPYRYSARDGRTDNPANMLITMDQNRSVIGDGARVAWDNNLVAPGSPLPGAFQFTGGDRLVPAGR